MQKSLQKLLRGYSKFRKKYIDDNCQIMDSLSVGQSPEVMVIACCDSRVDPALLLQCDPGDLFVVRNVANLVPPYAKDTGHHGTSAALEYGVRFLKVKHLVILGHSQCGGIQAMLKGTEGIDTDFIQEWVDIIQDASGQGTVNDSARRALDISYNNCLQFPWLLQAVQNKELQIHRWFFDISEGTIYTHESDDAPYRALDL